MTSFSVFWMCIIHVPFFFLYRSSSLFYYNTMPKNNDHHVNIGAFHYRTPLENRAILDQYNFHVNRRTVLVHFRFRVNVRNPASTTTTTTTTTTSSWRTATMVVQLDRDASSMSLEELDKELKKQLHDALLSGGGQQLSGDGTEEDNYTPVTIEEDESEGGGDYSSISVIARTIALDNDDIMYTLGVKGIPSAPHHTKMYGYREEQQPQHRSFRYMIEGCDMKTLHPLVPDSWMTQHNHECDQMCAYRMLADLNKVPGNFQPPKIFRPEEVNRWLNENGYFVGGLRDGVTSDDIQAHAVQHRYGHCAMDLSRSILNLHIPTDRHPHHKSACYVVVGNHCQPIVDSNVVRSIMQSGSARLGRRNVVSTMPSTVLFSSSRSVEESLNNNLQRRKRRRSLDRIFRPEFDRSEERQLQDQWKTTTSGTTSALQHDITVDDWEEDFSDNGSSQLIPDTKDNRKQQKLPLVSETERFHFFTKAENLDIVEEKCRPDYKEGNDMTLIHYYICTDEDDVEFLYQYLVRVMKIDPLRYARTFNGRCRQIRMQNVWWCANKDIDLLMKVHSVFHPQEPLRVGGMATYAFRLLQQQLFHLTRKAGAIWECMSHYPPNLQRLMDTNHPFARPKLIQHTFQPPYSNPKDSSRTATSPPVITTLIPMNQRRRIDLVRSYASVIRNLKDDEFPIHDPTNQVVLFSDTLHESIPIGHYLVDIPTVESLKTREDSLKCIEGWRRLPCLPHGEARMMSHRMVRALLHRQLIQKTDIRLVCPTDPIRQKKYGMALVHALQDVLEKIYKHKDLQNLCPKHLINHLVGLCNGTTLPHSGMRYVFQDMSHLYNLLLSILSEDQLRKVKVLHTMGYDPLWHKSFDYYEIDCSGMAYRSFHMQPVFHMVLEEQALHVFDIAQTIPLANLIQINVDAIEYKVDAQFHAPTWARELEQKTIDNTAYKAATPADMYDTMFGKYRTESPKDETKALTYYYKFQQTHAATAVSQYWNNHKVTDTEHIDWIPDWRSSLRKTDVVSIDQLLVDMFTKEDRNMDLSGLIVTGPAGTGKTHFIRRLQGYASNLGYSVVKTAFTHAACVQMGCDAITLSSLFGMDEKADMRYTMAMSRKFGAQLRALNIDILIVDEISMIPIILLEALMMFHRVSSKTRICCFGDFNQLPPVEPQWERNNNDTYNYFDNTDIFPYLVYDRVKNTHGRWLQLTKCMRTSDPLLVRICQDPTSVKTIQHADFPMPSTGIPIWRFISWRNSTRKACNFYCMHRFLQLHPTNVKHRFVLGDIYAEKKMDELKNKNKKKPEENANATTTAATSSYDMDYFRKQFDTGSSIYRPGHWNYLQTFTYAVDMQVVCRNTLKEWDKSHNNNAASNAAVRPECVNNRRAVIIDIDVNNKLVTIRWMDIIRRFEDFTESGGGDVITTTPIEEFDIILTFYDFAFNFVPGFCITAHMAQGETIREHYGLLEWQEMSAMPKMAYVAVTRGSSSEFLHIVPPYADPWNHNSNDTSNLSDNILTKLFHAFRWDKKQNYVLDVEDVLKMAHNTPCCTLCNVTLMYTRYSYKNNEQFAIAPQKQDSLSPEDCIIVCNSCLSANRKSSSRAAAPNVKTG